LRFSRGYLWMLPCSAIWRRVVCIWTYVMEGRIVSIFMVENPAPAHSYREVTSHWFAQWAREVSSEPMRTVAILFLLSSKQYMSSILAAWLILRSHLLPYRFFLGWNSTLKIDAIWSSETSVHIRTIRYYVPEDGNIPFFDKLFLRLSLILSILQYCNTMRLIWLKCDGFLKG
jgi:hypothetical protein